MFPRCQFGQILGLLFLSANQDDPLNETHRPTEVENEVSLRAAPLLTIFTSLKRKQYEFRGSSLRCCLEGQPAEERPTTYAQGSATVVVLEPTPRIFIPAYPRAFLGDHGSDIMYKPRTSPFWAGRFG